MPSSPASCCAGDSSKTCGGSATNYIYTVMGTVSASASTSTGVAMTTSWGEDGGGNTIYLDRQNVACNAGNVITSFKLGRLVPDLNNPSLNRIRYEVRAIQLSAAMQQVQGGPACKTPHPTVPRLPSAVYLRPGLQCGHA